MRRIAMTSQILEGMKWTGTAAGIIGAIIIALNLGLNEYGYGLFLVSSVLWTTVAIVQREASLALLQVTFTVINVIGLFRYSAILAGN
jgi:hypothetical protein